nr:unnamed protein product [Digitaria exilis]
MAHHVAVALGSSSGSGGLRIVDDEDVTAAARVVGYVLLWPFFAGDERTKSEAESPAGPHVTLPVYDQFSRLSLPVGATRDHPALNPFGPGSPALDAVAMPPVLVVVGELDLLRDRVVDSLGSITASSPSSRGATRETS